MSTRSRVGLLTKAGQVESIYVHFDGYVEEPGVGAKLANKWTNVEDVRSLLALGDLSQLGSSLGEDRGTGWFDERMQMSFDDPRRHADECIAYRRDRGESDVDAVVHGVDEWPDYGQEYEYLFDPGTGSWSYREVYPERGPWTPLS